MKNISRRLSKASVMVRAGAILLFGAVSGLALAQTHDHQKMPAHMDMTAMKAKAVGDPYLLPTDPVTGEKLGENAVVLQLHGREFRFASEANADKFKAAPQAYIPKVDQAMIAEQTPFYPLKTCMVSGEKLGGDMGKPVDMIYNNRLIRFCCPMCKDDFAKDPAKYIQKLDAAVIAEQAPKYPLTACMVSGEKLGGDMGKPQMHVAGNRLIEFCCPACLPKFQKDPSAFIARLDAAASVQK